MLCGKKLLPLDIQKRQLSYHGHQSHNICLAAPQAGFRTQFARNHSGRTGKIFHRQSCRLPADGSPHPRRLQRPVHCYWWGGTAGHPALRTIAPPCHPAGRRHAELAGCRPRNFVVAACPRHEERNPARRTDGNHQAAVRDVQQLQGPTADFGFAYRRHRHSLQLAHRQQRRLSAGQAPLGRGICRCASRACCGIL